MTQQTSRRVFLGALGAVAVRLAAQQEAPKPNIVFILADDLGYGDLGCYGQERIATPNIDKLAAEGMRFTQVYAGSTVCAPARSCLMTGLHTGHTRVRGNSSPSLGRVPLRPEDATVAEALQSGGYATGMFGKWGLGEAGTTGIPNRKGFDEFYGYLNQSHAHDYYPEHLWHNRSEVFLRGNRGARKEAYAHDLIVDRALEWLDGVAGRQPFFLYLPVTVPHANNELGADTGDGMEAPHYGPYEKEEWPYPEKGFAAMIHFLDRDVGRLMAKLREKGVDEETLVIFTSDNGPHSEGGHDPEFFGSRGGLRGTKRDLYEGGIRVPAIARWPGRISAGVTSDQIWAFWDFFPTACEAAGIEPPSGLDGISMLPAFLGASQRQHESLYWEFGEGGRFRQAIRVGKWKAVRLGPAEPVELYDLDNDLAETRDIAAQHPDKVRMIERLLVSSRTESKEFPSPFV